MMIVLTLIPYLSFNVWVELDAVLQHLLANDGFQVLIILAPVLDPALLPLLEPGILGQGDQQTS